MGKGILKVTSKPFSLKDVNLVIPCAGEHESLARLLKSLHDIYGTSFMKQVTIVSNCSADEDKKKVQDLSIKYRTEFIHENKKGKAYAVNKAISRSKKELVAFLDDDTIVLQKHLLSAVRWFNAYPKLAYVSGNVVSVNTFNNVSRAWEKKGGLSKGSDVKHWSTKYLQSSSFRYKPWQFNKICAGANSVIKRDVLLEIRGFNILLEGSGPFHAGATIEIGYKIAKANYELVYDPKLEVGHYHPEEMSALRKKMWNYGLADSAYQMSNYIQYKDFRCLWWSLFGHSYYTISQKLVPRISGKYPLDYNLILVGLFGNMLGGVYFALYYLLLGKKILKEYYSGS